MLAEKTSKCNVEQRGRSRSNLLSQPIPTHEHERSDRIFEFTAFSDTGGTDLVDQTSTRRCLRSRRGFRRIAAPGPALTCYAYRCQGWERSTLPSWMKLPNPSDRVDLPCKKCQVAVSYEFLHNSALLLRLAVFRNKTELLPAFTDFMGRLTAVTVGGGKK